MLTNFVRLDRARRVRRRTARRCHSSTSALGMVGHRHVHDGVAGRRRRAWAVRGEGPDEPTREVPTSGWSVPLAPRLRASAFEQKHRVDRSLCAGNIGRVIRRPPRSSLARLVIGLDLAGTDFCATRGRLQWRSTSRPSTHSSATYSPSANVSADADRFESVRRHGHLLDLIAR
jgi:hypothetical protein